MLNVELQPAVRQIVERNEQLEEENKRLLEKIHELLTEVTAMKATRHKFRLDCESLLQNHASELLSPSREMKQKLKRQRRQIDNLQNQLTSTKTELEATLHEKNDLQDNFEKHEDTLEKVQQDEADATKSCKEMAQSLSNLIGIISNKNMNDDNGSDEEIIDQITDLPGAILFLQKKILRLSEKCSTLAKVNDEVSLDIANNRQQISTLETTIQCLEKKNETLEECNSKYVNEREELGSAISTLRTALNEIKKNLVTTEEEKKELKKENVKLRIELDTIKEHQTADNDIGNDDDDSY